jgi:hypothetical protein
MKSLRSSVSDEIQTINLPNEIQKRYCTPHATSENNIWSKRDINNKTGDV